MGIKIDFTTVRHEACQRCGHLDDAGGLELQDDQHVVKILCRNCTLKLVTVCLEPGGNGKGSH